ncbi:MFS transporter [soil metagenome]
MSTTTPKPLWAGRWLPLLGIILIALNLRTAVAALSPIIPRIAEDIPIDSVGLGFIGMLPPIAFAASGILAPVVARRVGLETSLVLACLAMVLGPVARAFAGNYAVLIIGSVITLAGMGFGNILLPPAVKKYFPDRIGVVTTAYATIMSIGAALAPVVAEPVAGAAGWRVSVGVWSVLAVTALIPWVFLLLERAAHHRRESDAGVVPEAPPELLGRMWHSRTAWAITLAFMVSALSAYAGFAWLPSILVDLAGVSAGEAGALVGLFAIMGLPAGLIVPLLAVRMRNVGLLIHAGAAAFVLGYLGLLFAPSVATALWVALIGLGSLMFPLCLVLINLRTRTPGASVALSGFVQSVGYAGGSLGPLVVGIIHAATSSWTVPLIFLIAVSLTGVIAGLVLAKPAFVEDEITAR